MYHTKIPLSELPAGIVNFYLFNSKNELISRRNVFINKNRYHLVIHPDKQNYLARSNINLNLKITDANNKPGIAGLSLAVVDKQLLDSTLNFFDNDTLQNLQQEEADLVMLTQNKKINPLYSNDSNFSGKNNDDTGFTLSGRITNKKNQPLQNAVATIFSNKPYLIFQTDTLKHNGEFNFNLPQYADSTQFTFQVTNFKRKNIEDYHLTFTNDSSLHFSTPPGLKTTFPLSDSLQSIKSQLAISNSAFAFAGRHWLKPVTVKTTKKPLVNYDESKRVSQFSEILTRDMLGEGPDMTSTMLLNNPKARRLFTGISNDPLLVIDGVQMSKDAIETSKTALAEAPSTTFQNPVLDYINSIPVNTIDFIEVLAGPEAAFYGTYGGHGVILINTRSGAENVLPAGPALKNFYAKGFYNDKPFDMPDYSDENLLKSKSPDLRTTIYWNGNIVTNKNGEASIQFYSADPATTYIGVITGITLNGDKIFQTFTLSRH